MGARLPAALCVAIMMFDSCAVTTRPTAPVVTTSGVRFVLALDGTHTVAVAGSFNGWSASSHSMVRDGRGLWTLLVPLPPGEYLFMYVVDGEWISPPIAEDYVDDGFGAQNGIVVVR